MILTLGGYFLFNTLYPRVKIEVEDASIVFIENLNYQDLQRDVNINDMLSVEESQMIKSIFNGKRLYFDNPSCGFGEDISIRFGDLIFCPASGESCPIVKFGNRYFKISEADREAIAQIFKKYGGFLPGA